MLRSSGEDIDPVAILDQVVHNDDSMCQTLASFCNSQSRSHGSRLSGVCLPMPVDMWKFGRMGKPFAPFLVSRHLKMTPAWTAVKVLTPMSSRRVSTNSWLSPCAASESIGVPESKTFSSLYVVSIAPGKGCHRRAY